jgi:hypothetical protein
MYRFFNEDAYLEFNVGDDYHNELLREDTIVSIKFSVNGFSGSSGEYILSSQLESFADSILKLESSRKGNAQLYTTVGDISFEIKSIDELGHFGIIFSSTEYAFLGNDYRTYEASAFFEIDPIQLVEFSKENWVSIYKSPDSINKKIVNFFDCLF